MKCPRCEREFDELLALSRKDNKTMICDECGSMEALDDAGFSEDSPVRNVIRSLYEGNRRATPQKRTRAQVYATGNIWAIENYEATH